MILITVIIGPGWLLFAILYSPIHGNAYDLNKSYSYHLSSEQCTNVQYKSKRFA